MFSKIFRRMGLWFLKLSGMDIPDALVENVFEPLILTKSYRYREGADAEELESAYSSAIKSLTEYVSSFIITEVRPVGDGWVEVIMKVVVQKQI